MLENVKNSLQEARELQIKEYEAELKGREIAIKEQEVQVKWMDAADSSIPGCECH